MKLSAQPATSDKLAPPPPKKKKKAVLLHDMMVLGGRGGIDGIVTLGCCNSCGVNEHLDLNTYSIHVFTFLSAQNVHCGHITQYEKTRESVS
jgi:hypothetical protein